jgi:hypothetical protein
MKVISNITLRVGTPEKMEYIPPGEPVNLPADDAKALIERGLAGKATPHEKEDDDDDDDLLEAIIDAIGDLDPAAFGKDGKPNVKAIEEIIGRSISASQRDRGWGAFQKLSDDD